MTQPALQSCIVCRGKGRAVQWKGTSLWQSTGWWWGWLGKTHTGSLPVLAWPTRLSSTRAFQHSTLRLKYQDYTTIDKQRYWFFALPYKYYLAGTGVKKWRISPHRASGLLLAAPPSSIFSWPCRAHTPQRTPSKRPVRTPPTWKSQRTLWKCPSQLPYWAFESTRLHCNQ